MNLSNEGEKRETNSFMKAPVATSAHVISTKAYQITIRMNK